MIYLFASLQTIRGIISFSLKEPCQDVSILKDKHFLGSIYGYAYVIVTHWISFKVSAKITNALLYFFNPSRIIIFLVPKSNNSLVKNSKHFFCLFVLFLRKQMTTVQFSLWKQDKVNYGLSIVVNTAYDTSDIFHFTEIWRFHSWTC